MSFRRPRQYFKRHLHWTLCTFVQADAGVPSSAYRKDAPFNCPVLVLYYSEGFDVHKVPAGSSSCLRDAFSKDVR